MINKMVAREGYVFALKDRSAVYDNVIYLGIYDSAENYIEITYVEAEELRKEFEEKANELLLKEQNELHLNEL